MEVVNKNVESKRDIIKKLKEINVNSVNKHQEVKIDSYITSIVMIITTSNVSGIEKEEYNVYMLVLNKKTNELYGKFYTKYMNNLKEADNYYNNLLNSAQKLTVTEIENIISL